jgi:hypothetical protein
MLNPQQLPVAAYLKIAKIPQAPSPQLAYERKSTEPSTIPDPPYTQSSQESRSRPHQLIHATALRCALIEGRAFGFGLAHSSHSRASCLGALHQLRSLGDSPVPSSIQLDFLNAATNPTNAIRGSLSDQENKELAATTRSLRFLDTGKTA